MPKKSATTAEDTIAAIATAPGQGAIGIVRLSGPGAMNIAAGLFRSSKGHGFLSEARPVLHGHIMDKDAPVDEVLVHRMRAPHSYTREDVVEINAHGGAGALSAILELVLRQGARLAAPGEFTKRAFLNGRIDLVQAEAVIDRIQAHTRAALRAADAAAGGLLSRRIQELSERLATALARVEAAVDFPEDDVPELITDALRAELGECREEMGGLLAGAEAGRLLREGARVAIVGRPNVGKSSLFNALLHDARAIVTHLPGTTRDVLEETISVEGIPVRLLDTAGLRESDDEVERIGVAAARDALRTAQAVLTVGEAPAGCTVEDQAIYAEAAALGVPLIWVWNKCDVAQPAGAPPETASVCQVSALSGQGLAELEQTMARVLLADAPAGGTDALINRAHQRQSLHKAHDAVGRVLSAYGASPEFLSIDLREALHALGEITGQTTPDDLLERIFAEFCIGK